MLVPLKYFEEKKAEEAIKLDESVWKFALCKSYGLDSCNDSCYCFIYWAF